MQADLFSQTEHENHSEQTEPLVLTESLKGYRQRTIDNAHGADLTVAIAIEFDTAGEHLTKRAAGQKYLAIEYGIDPQVAAAALQKAMRTHRVRILNVAGNSLKTFNRNGVSQQDINQWLLVVFSQAFKSMRPLQIRSGGQTGMDWAGLVCALQLGINAHGHFPEGFLQRGGDGKDYTQAAAEVLSRLLSEATRNPMQA